MREIKFRAWDKEFKKWSKIPLKYSIEDINYMNDYEWSQYTGLKDYSGREIYEGDVVEEVVSNKPERFKVIWDEIGAMFLFSHLAKMHDGALDYYDIEEEIGDIIVIGNIYEKPELLEGVSN